MDAAPHPTAPPLPTLLCLSHLRWDFVFQRPQHLLTRAAAEYRVVFFEEPWFTDTAVPSLHARNARGRAGGDAAPPLGLSTRRGPTRRSAPSWMVCWQSSQGRWRSPGITPHWLSPSPAISGRRSPYSTSWTNFPRLPMRHPGCRCWSGGCCGRRTWCSPAVAACTRRNDSCTAVSTYFPAASTPSTFVPPATALAHMASLPTR